MELFTLDGSFQPYDLIENYQSLIWTERYSKNGDFQIVFNDIATGVRLLPLESFVTIRESTVPMIVEVHKIEKKKNAAPTITITGRSMETVLERRASVNSLLPDSARPAWKIPANKPSDAAFLMMRTVLSDDPVYVSGFTVLPGCFPAVDVKDVIPEISLIQPADYSLPEWRADVTYKTDDIVGYGDYMYISLEDNNLNHVPALPEGHWYVFSTQGALPPEGAVTAELYTIEPKDLYSSAMDLITQNNRGLKAVRPLPGGTRVGIEIYNGADLTADVVFDAKFDQIDDATYLLSYTGSANTAYYYSPGGSSLVLKLNYVGGIGTWLSTLPYGIGAKVIYRGIAYSSLTMGNLNHIPSSSPSNWEEVTGETGLARRVIAVTSTEAYANDPETRRSLGLIELYKYNATALFDGAVAEQVAAGYNRDYFLGDILKLQGDYGISENVRVAEFIRSSDATGDKAYPTFETVDG